MPYIFDTVEQRSNLMSKIKSSDTKAEIVLRKALWQSGLRYRQNYMQLPGKPDIVITKYKIAIFVDGEFWHGYNWEEKKQKIRNNREYWIPKIEKNIKRDLEVNGMLNNLGYKVIRFWEKKVKSDLNGCVEKIVIETGKG